MKSGNIFVQAERLSAKTTAKWKTFIAALNRSSTPEEMQLCLERTRKLEAEASLLFQQYGKLCQLQKSNDELCDAEKHEMAKEILDGVSSINKEVQSKIQAKTLLPIINAFDALNKSQNYLLETVQEEKRHLSASLQIAREKIISNKELAKVEEEILEDRISRLETCYHVVKEGSKAVEAEVTEDATRLSSLQKQTARLEQLSGIKCFVVDDLTLEITLLNDALPDPRCDLSLVATLLFTMDEEGCLVLSQVDTIQDIQLPSSSLKSAIANDDLPKLVRILKETWCTDSILMSEISCLRRSHAIDWKPEERILHLMFGKCIVCRLTVPPKYPNSLHGSICLDQIVGSSGDITVDSVSLQDPARLTEWVTHLEAVLAENLST